MPGLHPIILVNTHLAGSQDALQCLTGGCLTALHLPPGAEKIKGAIGSGAVYASEKIAQAGLKMQERVKPNEQPMKIDPRTQAL